ETHGLPVVVTRSSNQFGPYQFPEKLIPFFVTNLVEGRKVPLYGDGLNVRDWMFVDDNCAAVDLVRRSGQVGEIYNIGAGNELTNREVTDRLLAALGKDDSWVDYVEDRKGHDRRYSITTDKVRALGWEPAHDFDSALEETIRFYLERRDWWEPLLSRVRNRGGGRVRIVVTGSRGQLGTELLALLGTQPHHEVLGLDLPEHDLTDRDHVLGVLTQWEPDLVLHCAAFTAVDRCESEPEPAYRANCAATRFVADGARRVGAHVVYVSTDYVFDGTKDSPYLEWDRPNPQSVYGRTKLGGEMEIDPGWTIARTSWMCSAHG